MGSIPEAEHACVPGIIDIRSDAEGIELKQLIRSGLKPKGDGEKTLPTLLLYDNKGLKLFEEITYLDQYYLTGQEIHVLGKYADRIAEKIPSGAMVVELGSGYGQLFWISITDDGVADIKQESSQSQAPA